MDDKKFYEDCQRYSKMLIYFFDLNGIEPSMAMTVMCQTEIIYAIQGKCSLEGFKNLLDLKLNAFKAARDKQNG